MRIKGISLLSVFVLTGLFLHAGPQLDIDKVKERKKWEIFLKSADIISHEDIGEGITKPKKLFLRLGPREEMGVWKNPEGIQKGFKDEWRYEIAAYEMDKLLGLGMVPPTVERRFRGRKGSLQLWIELEMDELERVKNEIKVPDEKKEKWQKSIYLARAFDSLIGNIDRTQQNIRYTKDWRLILIDHSRSFRTKRIYTDQLIYGKHGMRSNMLFPTLPRKFVEAVKSLSYDSIKEAVGDYLGYYEIEAVLARKKLLIKEVNDMIKERGEEAVLY
ncbi:MAG: hypothetical protein J7L72_02430 [Candidatus Aminicenantes bacterium]|nr:hypothetical protein [Candidatus Aminicenantes bacterium]